MSELSEPHYAKWNIAQKLADVLTRNHGADQMEIEETRHPAGEAWVIHFRVFRNFDSRTLNGIFTYWELDPASMLEWRAESWSHKSLIVRMWVLKEVAPAPNARPKRGGDESAQLPSLDGGHGKAGGDRWKCGDCGERRQPATWWLAHATCPHCGSFNLVKEAVAPAPNGERFERDEDLDCADCPDYGEYQARCKNIVAPFKRDVSGGTTLDGKAGGDLEFDADHRGIDCEDCEHVTTMHTSFMDGKPVRACVKAVSAIGGGKPCSTRRTDPHFKPYKTEGDD